MNLSHRPIFVIGAERSGIGMLTWSLAQHPKIVAAPDSRLVADLHNTVHLEVLYRSAGRGFPDNDFKGKRWVVGSTALASSIRALLKVFPEAQIVHTMRDFESSIQALTNRELSTLYHTSYTVEQAHDHWRRTTRAYVELESELGSSAVLRVGYQELVGAPEATLRKCLDFLGEPFSSACLRLLSEQIRSNGRCVVERPATSCQHLNSNSASIDTSRLPDPATCGKSRSTLTVVLVANQFPKNSETFIVSKFLGLLARGWNAHVVCKSNDPRQWDLYPSIACNSERLARVHVARDLEAELWELRPDVLHFEFGPLALNRLHLGEALGARTVVSFRGYDLNDFRLEDTGCYQEVWEKADLVHLVSNDLWLRAQRRGCSPDKAHVIIPDAVDTTFFSATDRLHAESAGSEDRPLRILSVGRLHWKKGYEYALQAVKQLGKAGLTCEYRVIGDGEQRDAVLFSIHDLSLSPVVHLLGAQPATEVKASMRWADLFLHPSLTEGFCVSAVEAQAMGLPVVCSDAGGLPENVVDKETGFVVPRRDATALAEKLYLLARQPALRQQLGEAGRLRVCTRLNLEQQIECFEAAYRQALAVPMAKPVTLSGKGASSEASKRRLSAREQVDRVRRVVDTFVPKGAKVLVVSKGDEELMNMNGRQTGHFPQTQDGVYAGYHLGNSEEAISHLRELRARGAEYLVFPATSVWWLDYYVGFKRYLESHYCKVVGDVESAVVFSLAPGYPDELLVRGPNKEAVRFLHTTQCRKLAEVGVYHGFSSEEFARYLDGAGELHLFDFEDRVLDVTTRLRARGYTNIVGHGNSRKTMDSYNWSLMHLLKQHPEPLFDYVFLDGAHTWPIDALAFFLLDRLLVVGGYIQFDDYPWSLEASPTVNPTVFPMTAECYTQEQIAEKHVRLIFDLLVRRDPRYKEVVPNRVFQKISELSKADKRAAGRRSVNEKQ